MSAALLAASQADDAHARRLAMDAPEAFWDEERHQVRLIEWVAAHVHVCPELNALMHVPSGGKREQRVDRKGVRYSPQAARLKRMGTRPGYPDLLLDVPLHGKAGLRLELKTFTGELRPDQRAWLVHLRAQGYHADVARGWRDARRLLLEYLSGQLQPWRWVPRDASKHSLPPLR